MVVQWYYAMVAESAYSAQAQADFGNTIIVIARADTTTRFTTKLSILAHQQAFAYLEGIPAKVVYDQDRLFLVSENHGDLILTEKFRFYSRVAGFALYGNKTTNQTLLPIVPHEWHPIGTR